MNNCGCKRPAFGPEPHAPVPLHGGGFVPNAIEWLKEKIDRLFGTAVFTVNGHEPEGGNVDVIVPSKVSELENDAGYLTEHQDVSGIAATAEEALSVATDAAENSVRIVNGKGPTDGNVKIVLDDLADKDGNIETTKTIMVSRDGGESHVAVALYSDLISEIDAHNNDGAAHPKLMTTIANNFATKTEVDAKADKSALQAEVDRAQAAETQLTTKANELDTAKLDKTGGVVDGDIEINGRQGLVVKSSPHYIGFRQPDDSIVYLQSLLDDKLDAGSTAADSAKLGGVEAGKYALKSNIPAVVAPSASATTGQAADAKAVNDALANKVDNGHGVIKYTLTFGTDDDPIQTQVSASSITRKVPSAGGDVMVTIDLPEKNGTFALTSDIAAAISGKANKSELPYSLVVKKIENGTVSLDDRADNYVDARTLGTSDSLDIDFPVLVDGRSRDFVLAVECGENPPTISYAAFATIMAEDASTLTPEPGMNIYAFTEFKTNMFLAARKTVDTVVVNTPESSNQVLLAMQKRGIDTTNITDFGKVANTLGLGDTATPQDAIDAVMN